MTTPITDSEKQRLVIAFEEERALHRAIDYVKSRLAEGRLREREMQWRVKESELHDNELAMLNVLEDARALEGELQKQRDRLRLIIDSMGEGLLFFEEGCLITYANIKAEDILGLAHGEAQGKCFHDIITVWKNNSILADTNDFLTKEFESGRAFSAALPDDFFFRTATREKFPVTFVFTPFVEHAKKRAVIVFRDVTEEKALDEARTNFISLASHQLRTPLTAIRWYTELLMEKEIGALNAMQAKFAQQIYEGTNRLSDMVNLLLSLARIEGGALEINPSVINISDHIGAIVDEFAPLAKKEGVSLTLGSPAHSLPALSMDPAMLREVMVNLIANAIRYSQKKGTITVLLAAGEREMTVTVKDTGIGIPAAQQGRIFEKFFRADNAVKKISQGTGLGLNLARSLVSLWGGKLWFASKEGEGSTFFFTIPYTGIQAKKAGKPLA